MNNKEQIIIDCVDVSGCISFLPAKKYCGLWRTGCRFLPDCYFKQLARKTQECEEQKEQLRRTRHIALNQTNNVNFYEKDNDRYRKALEEIEEVYETAMEGVTTYDEQADLNITIEALHNILDIIDKVKGQ